MLLCEQDECRILRQIFALVYDIYAIDAFIFASLEQMS
jgi:hypothetical protein